MGTQWKNVLLQWNHVLEVRNINYCIYDSLEVFGLSMVVCMPLLCMHSFQLYCGSTVNHGLVIVVSNFRVLRIAIAVLELAVTAVVFQKVLYFVLTCHFSKF